MIIVSALLALISSCKYSQEYQIITVENQFSVSVPSWMKKYDDLKPGAPFQYANRYRNFYTVADASKLSPGELMANTTSLLIKSMKNAVVSDSSSVTINGLQAVRAEVFGKMNDENIYFTELVIQGKKSNYHLSIWTRGEDRKLRYKEDINKIASSFKEL